MLRILLEGAALYLLVLPTHDHLSWVGQLWLSGWFSVMASGLAWSSYSSLGKKSEPYMFVFVFRAVVLERPETCMSPTHPARSSPSMSGLGKSWAQRCVARSSWWVPDVNYFPLARTHTAFSLPSPLHHIISSHGRGSVCMANPRIQISISEMESYPQKELHVFQRHTISWNMMPSSSMWST